MKILVCVLIIVHFVAVFVSASDSADDAVFSTKSGSNDTEDADLDIDIIEEVPVVCSFC
jgi:hypothetical protein